MLKNVRGRTSYRDNTVQSGKCYYYQIRAFQTKNDTKSIHAVSKILQVRVRTLSAPVIKIQKKQSGSVRYLILKLQKYEGKKLEVYYKKSKWASYQKIALYANDIKRQKGIFRLQYLSSEEQLYLRVRTFERKNGKKIYSKYAKEVKIKT